VTSAASDQPTDESEPRSAQRLRLVTEARVRQGLARVRLALVPMMLASVAAALAYAIDQRVLGHPHPFFAPVAAWIALGFSSDRQLRRVAELAIGVTVGVAAGDFVVHVIGSGPWQLGLVLVLTGLAARFLDRGALLATQAGVQALVVVGLPALPSGGPVGRWTDALLGGAVALVFAALSPSDPRARSRVQAREALGELGLMLRDLGSGLRAGDGDAIADALVRGRASQPALDDWRATARNAGEIARVSPGRRRLSGELARLEEAAAKTDYAMRNSRVIARRAISLVESEHDLEDVGGVVERLSVLAARLGAALGSGTDVTGLRSDLVALAGEVDPVALAHEDWQAQGLVLLLRSLVVDLLMVSGLPLAAAKTALPRI